MSYKLFVVTSEVDGRVTSSLHLDENECQHEVSKFHKQYAQERLGEEGDHYWIQYEAVSLPKGKRLADDHGVPAYMFALTPLGDAILDAMADLEEYKPESAARLMERFASLFQDADTVGWAEVVSAPGHRKSVKHLAQALGVKVA